MADERSTDSDANSAVIEIPPLEGVYAQPFSLNKMWHMAGFFGPAAMVASLSLGAGETIMATGLGAWSEFGLLWLLLLSVVVKGIFVTYLVGRFTAITGQPIGERLVQMPGPRGWLLITIVIVEIGLISMGLTVVAKPCGNLLAFLLFDRIATGPSFEMWQNIATTLFLGAALCFSLLSSYRVLEKQQIFICGLLVVGTATATVIVGPNLTSLVEGALSFGHLPATPDWAPEAARDHYVLNLVTIFGYVGGSLSGYLAYSNWIGLRGWGLTGHPEIEQIRARAKADSRFQYLPNDVEQASRLRTLLTPLRWDVGMGALVLFLVTAAFLASGAVVLYPRQHVLPGNAFELLTKQVGIWEQIHRSLVPVYYVLVVCALWGTLATVPEAICRMVQGFLSAIWPRFAQFPYRRLKAIVVGWFFVTSLVWIWSGVSFNLMTQVGAFLTLNLGVAVVCIAVVYFNATLPRLYRPHWLTLVGGAASAIVLLACAAGSAVGLASKLMSAWQTP